MICEPDHAAVENIEIEKIAGADDNSGVDAQIAGLHTNAGVNRTIALPPVTELSA